MKRLIILIAMSFSLVSARQSAQTSNQANIPSSTRGADTTKTFEFPEVVVTATRLERNPAEVGRSISLISHDRIKNSLFSSLAEALSEEEGLYIVGTGQTPGMIQSMFMRGAASNQTAILIDDVRITDPSAVNNALDVSELSSVGLDRVEIVRGSHSTLYGSSAIGGVVNLMTQKNRAPGFHIDAEAKTGTFGKGTSLFAQDLFLNYTDPTGFYFNGEVNNANFRGLDATVDTITNLNAFKNRDHDGFKKLDLLGKIGFKNELYDFYLSYKNTRQKTDIDKGAYRDDDNSTLDFKRSLLTYGASYALSEAVNVKYIGGYSAMNRVAVDDSSVIDARGNTDQTYSDGESKGTTSTNEVQGSVKLPGFEAVLGAGVYRETMSSRSYYYTRSSFGVYESTTDLDSLDLYATTNNLFAHADVNGAVFHKALRGFTFAFGVRLNDHSTFGNNMTYEFNPSLKVTDEGLLYVSYSTGFNAPSLYQLYSPDTYYSSGIPRGNKHLQPETSSSFEIGFKQSLRTISFSMSYFRTVVENSIEYVFLWDKNISIDTLGNDWMRDDFRGDTYLNAGTQTTTGIELNFHSRVNERLWFSANASFVGGKLKYRPSEINTVHTAGNHVQIYNNGAFLNRVVETVGLVRRPNTVNVSLRYQPIEDLTLRLDVRYVGSRNDVYYNSKLRPYGALATLPVDEYMLIDLSEKFIVSDNLALHARIENILNTKYSEINGFSTRGRGLFVGLRYLFDAAY